MEEIHQENNVVVEIIILYSINNVFIGNICYN